MKGRASRKKPAVAPGEIDINQVVAALRSLWRKRKLAGTTGKLVCEMHWKDGEMRGAEFIEGTKLNPPPEQERLFP